MSSKADYLKKYLEPEKRKKKKKVKSKGYSRVRAKRTSFHVHVTTENQILAHDDPWNPELKMFRKFNSPR